MSLSVGCKGSLQRCGEIMTRANAFCVFGQQHGTHSFSGEGRSRARLYDGKLFFELGTRRAVRVV